MCRTRKPDRTGTPIVLLLLAFHAHSFASPAAHVSYDRAWWNATESDQRTEFLAGYGDCAVSDFGEVELANAQWNVIEQEISRYDATHTKAEEGVPSLFVRFGSSRPPSMDPAPEIYSEPHGFFDGDYRR
jgi:hypothetical protein